MSRSATKDHLFIHALGFSFVVLFLIFVTAYQSVRQENGQPLSLKSILSPLGFFRMFASLQKTDTQLNIDDIYFLRKTHSGIQIMKNPSDPRELATIMNMPTSELVFTADKSRFAYQSSEVEITLQQVDGKKLIWQPEKASASKAASIIHWNKAGDKLYVAALSDTYAIYEISLDGTAKKILEGIHYPEHKLTRSYEPISTYILFPDCQEYCELKTYSIPDGNIATIGAISDFSEEDRLKTLYFEYFQEKDNTVGYWTKEDDRPFRFYVIKHNGTHNEPRPTLVQSVHLDANRDRLIYYSGFVPQSQHLVFYTDPVNSGERELFAYRADKPSLRLLKTVGKNGEFSLMNNDGTYAVGQDLYNVRLPNWHITLEDDAIPFKVR